MSRIGANTELRTTSADFELRDEHKDEDGRTWIYVQAGALLTAGTLGIVSEDGQFNVANTTNTATARGDTCAIGVAGFADNDYGWACIEGTGTDIVLLVAANCAANVPLNSTAGSSLDDDATSGAEVIDGVVILTANGGSEATVQCNLSRPTVGATIA